MLLDISHKLFIHRRGVTTRHHRHIDRRSAWRGEDKALLRNVAVVAIGDKSQHGLTLAHLNVQHTIVGDIRRGTIDKAIAADSLLDTRQINLRNRSADGGDTTRCNPLFNQLA